MTKNEEQKLLQESLRRLLVWYASVRRELPWRIAPTPYTVWISEIMLQQTRIEAVIPYYHRFLSELPDVAALAAVPEDRLLKLWEGLGYYSRARNLKKAAQLVMDEYGGELPRQAALLKKLPGIGDYTAGAIASIAYGEPESAVDGNVLRVIMRLTACEDDVLSQKTKTRIAEALRKIYPAGPDAALATEGLMELGETVCVPNGAPRCADCPLAALCLARRDGRCEELPRRSEKKARRVEEKTILLLRCGERYALRQRPKTGLLAGMWELPNLPGRLDEPALREALRAQGLKPGEIRKCGETKHIFTHIEWHMQGYFVDISPESGEYLWKSAAEIAREHAVPTAFQAYLKLLK
ncbi:MAG: A/G-specific adenine glycosylase [Oscillospiraceae bacterium]|nr:A/G-specific adenine glycosylase [Oscillospiraceae bacterium]